jgi:hypothetical protein
VTAALAAALRACAAGLYCGEAGTELLIGHGAFLRRDDFSAFICEGTSITDGTTPMASIDWETAIAALNAGNLPASSGERSVLQYSPSRSPLSRERDAPSPRLHPARNYADTSNGQTTRNADAVTPMTAANEDPRHSRGIGIDPLMRMSA